ncbi:hypothetical protein ADIS_0610 [Lunatimonas lonarensis]|uniref:Uncharacterized protein n=1 Tax=Lunatimonas lonarensis TaxID=1232681 RepID=R7ZXH4_9BACT|nr:hypothetical protein ADIS_0610 [Lunatimonas lonarensis]
MSPVLSWQSVARGATTTIPRGCRLGKAIYYLPPNPKVG